MVVRNGHMHKHYPNPRTSISCSIPIRKDNLGAIYPLGIFHIEA